MSVVEPPAGEPAAEENKLIAERRAKLAQLRASGSGSVGGDSGGTGTGGTGTGGAGTGGAGTGGAGTGGAYPNDYRRDALAGQLHAAFGERSGEWLEANPSHVSVGGRLMFKRVMGKASFAKIGDRTGQIQLYLQQETLGKAYDAFKGFDVGDILGASGVLFRTRTGELSVRVESLRLLVKSLRPLPDKWHGLADTETRYRQRYVDLIMSDAARQVFRTRTRIVRYLRDFLDSLDFLEVETPMLQPIPGGAAARPFSTHHNALGLDMYLRIAPELYLKRLIVGGLERVYEINRNFRNEGLSTQHNPEFTMLELYLAYADYGDLMDWVEKAIRGLSDSLNGTQRVVYQGRSYDLARPFKRLTVEQAIVQHNPDIDVKLLRDPAYLRRRCEQLALKVEPQDGPGKLQMTLFDKTVESALLDPTFVFAYPTEVSPLSRRNDADPFIADRFEFYLAGREIANGFSELNDPEDQAARFHAQVARKDRGDEEAMFYDADYVRALEYGMPPTAGLGVGIDRLVMFFTDSPSIRDVILFPHLRPEAS
jgi:lysyl-tRNA synthetase, class II